MRLHLLIMSIYIPIIYQCISTGAGEERFELWNENFTLKYFFILCCGIPG